MQNAFFGAIQITANADTSKYAYKGYAYVLMKEGAAEGTY